jgi:hypothetical protein
MDSLHVTSFFFACSSSTFSCSSLRFDGGGNDIFSVRVRGHVRRVMAWRYRYQYSSSDFVIDRSESCSVSVSTAPVIRDAPSYRSHAPYRVGHPVRTLATITGNRSFILDEIDYSFDPLHLVDRGYLVRVTRSSDGCCSVSCPRLCIK